MITLNPGTVVAIKFGLWEHWGIVAFDLYGRLTLISNRGVKNGVTEELWQYVVGNAKWRIVKDLASEMPGYFIVERARSMVGTRYDFFRWNCQDLVYWALGLQPQSPQRDAAAALLSVAGLVVFLGMAGKRA